MAADLPGLYSQTIQPTPCNCSPYRPACIIAFQEVVETHASECPLFDWSVASGHTRPGCRPALLECRPRFGSLRVGVLRCPREVSRGQAACHYGNHTQRTERALPAL